MASWKSPSCMGKWMSKRFDLLTGQLDIFPSSNEGKTKLATVDGFTVWDLYYRSVKSYTRNSTRDKCFCSACICGWYVLSV